MITPDILIIAPPDDGHSLFIQKKIQDMDSSLKVIVFNNEDFPQKVCLQTHFSNNKQQISLTYEDHQICLDKVRSAWYRRVKQPVVDPIIEDPINKEFTFRESEHAILGLWQSMRCFWVNSPIHDRAAIYKVNQLRLAQEVGLQIPDTLITNNPQEVRKFYQSHKQIIYKQLKGIKNKLVQTRVVSEKEMEMIDSVRLAPVIFQELIPAKYDIRVTVIDNEIFPVRIDSQQGQSKLDWRWDHGTNMEKYELPEEICHKIRLLMQKMGLIYGAIDFRMTPNDECIFFEVNPSGQFLFNEIRAEWPLAEKFASLLIRGKRLG